MKEIIAMLIRIGSIDNLKLLWGGRDQFEKNKIIHINNILYGRRLLDLYPLYRK